MPDHSFGKEIFPNTLSKPSLMQLQAIEVFSFSSKDLRSYIVPDYPEVTYITGNVKRH